MRVYVSSASAAIGPPILAYAECRMFAVLARHPFVQGARVLLRHDSIEGKVRCSVTIQFVTAGSARAHATGPHAAATIDCAVGRVVRLIRRRFQRDAVGA